MLDEARAVIAVARPRGVRALSCSSTWHARGRWAGKPGRLPVLCKRQIRPASGWKGGHGGHCFCLFDNALL